MDLFQATNYLKRTHCQEIYLILSSIFKLSKSLKLMTRMLCCVTPVNRQTSRDHTLPDNLLLETNTSYTSRGHALPDNTSH
jgi:hypothetical protein